MADALTEALHRARLALVRLWLAGLLALAVLAVPFHAAADGAKSLKGPFDHSSARNISGFRGLERIGGHMLSVNTYDSSLYRINLATGAAVRLGPTGTLAKPWGIMRRGGLTYLTNYDDGELHILNDDFTTTLVGNSGLRYLGSLEEHNSKIYSIGSLMEGETSRPQLCEVDFSDGACAPVGEVPGKYPTGLLSFEGLLYLSDPGNQDLYRIDSIDNGVSATLIRNDTGVGIEDMFVVDGAVYAVGFRGVANDVLRTLDLATGQTTQIAELHAASNSSFRSVAAARLGETLQAAAGGNLCTVKAHASAGD